jgi:hypothetical protein
MTEDNSSDSGLDELYHSYWEVHNEKLGSHSPLEIAAILMTQSLTIYKTVLDKVSLFNFDNIDLMDVNSSFNIE